LEEYYDNSKKKEEEERRRRRRERERERDIRNHMVGGAGGARSRWNMYIREEKESQRSKSQ